MKAILLVRVSTKVQDFDEQEKEIYRMAVKDGYKPEDIISICEKESGIKLPEEERAGLNRTDRIRQYYKLCLLLGSITYRQKEEDKF